MSPPHRILVLGIGELGHAVLTYLATHPLRSSASITVLLRSAKPVLSAQFEAWNVSTLFADIGTAPKAEIVDFFKDFDLVIGCTGMALPPGTQLKLAHAVIEAGIERYFPWQFGVDYDVIGRGSGQPLFDEQLDVRDLLRGQSGVQWVVVSTGMFMPFIFEEIFGVVTGLDGEGTVKVRTLGGSENKVTLTTVEDIGHVVAEAVFAAPDTQGVIYTSGQTLSYGELGDLVTHLLKDRKVEVQDWTLQKLRAELDEQPTDAMRKYRNVFGAGKGVWWDEETTWDKERGLKLLTAREWAEENLVKKR